MNDELTHSKTNDINNIRCEISRSIMEVARITTAIIMKNLIMCLSPLLKTHFHSKKHQILVRKSHTHTHTRTNKPTYISPLAINHHWPPTTLTSNPQLSKTVAHNLPPQPQLHTLPKSKPSKQQHATSAYLYHQSKNNNRTKQHN